MRLTTSGIAWCGEVTAKKFQRIRIHGESFSQYRQAKRKDENIEANKEKGILSKTLATILLDCPVVLTKRIMNYLLRCRKQMLF
jgi:DNA polymerase-1